MSKGTKKVGTAGRFGARYGVRVRKLYKEIEKLSKSRYECPNCHHISVRRVASGVWACRHCEIKFAAGAYSPTTKKITSEEMVLKEEAKGGE
ncbi:MAG: 50S ribosomal protein L37ae [Methanomassiliicoccales archaeon]